MAADIWDVPTLFMRVIHCQLCSEGGIRARRGAPADTPLDSVQSLIYMHVAQKSSKLQTEWKCFFWGGAAFYMKPFILLVATKSSD